MANPRNPKSTALPLLVVFWFLLGSCKSPTNSEVHAQTRRAPSPAPRQPTATPPPLRPLRIVYSLLDNRLLAHWSVRQGLFVPGDYGLAKYLDHGRFAGDWRVGPQQMAGGAVPARRVTRLVLPLSAAQARAKALTLRLKVPAPASLRLRIGGVALPVSRLEKGWQQPRVAVAAGLLKSGDNRLSLDWGSDRAGRRLAWLHVGAPSPKAGAALPRVSAGQLHLPPGTGISWLVYPPRAARLALEASAKQVEASAKQSCNLRVSAAASAGQKMERVFSLTHKATPSSEIGFLRVDLGALSERVVRLTLSLPAKGCAGVVVRKAALGIIDASAAKGPAARLAGPAAKGTSAPAARPPKNVLLWVVDTARADHYPLYDKRSRVQTPRLAKLVAGGVLFENAYSAGSESMAGYGALWTGAYPLQNGQLGFAWRRALPKEWTTLSEALSKSGRRTGCFSANGFASAKVGYSAGCDRYHNAIHDHGAKSAAALVERALTFVKQRRSKPFFLYLGTIDPHVTLRAREPWISRYHPAPYKGPFKKMLPGLAAARFKEAVYARRGEKVLKKPVGARHRKRIIAIYDSTISYNDQQLGRLLAALEKLGVAKDTLVIVTADHGEELWDEGGFGHGHSLKDFVTRVPLVIHYPRLFRPGARVREAVSGVDVMPTILEALGRKVPDNVQGRGLRRLIDGSGAGMPRGVLVTRLGQDFALRLARYKLIAMRGKPAALYQITGVKERTSKDALARRWLTDVLGTFLVYQKRWRTTRWGDLANHKAALATDLEQGTAPECLGSSAVLPPPAYR